MNMNSQEFIPGTVVEVTSALEISISCRDLLDTDTFSRSDPMCVVFHQAFGLRQWVELLRTEVVQDCLNPDFVTKVALNYRFEEEQPLRFEVYDVDGSSTFLMDHDYLGFAECTLGQIVSAGVHALTLPLSQGRTNYKEETTGAKRKPTKGSISLLAEELSALKEEANLTLEGHCMGSSLFLCLCVPRVFFTLSKVNESGSYTLVYRSESYPGEDPLWRPFSLSLSRLCNGDRERVLRIQCFRQGLSGYHTLIGSLDTTFSRIESSAGLSEGNYLSGPQLKSDSAFLVFRECKVGPIHTFVDFIRSGTQIHLTFAIDFTASNGEPSHPTSLHSFAQNSGPGNPYEQAIQSVGDIVKDYDPSQTFAVYGFGARVPPTGVVSHDFHVTFNSTPFCHGIESVIGAYRKCIRQVQLAGPTNFSPIIRSVARMAEGHMEGKDYYVLLMVTDGIINDMELTKEAIVNASGLPLSIVIVGVGGAEFENMEELDGDVVRLSSKGRFAQRDIVQFIPYRNAHSWLSKFEEGVGLEVEGTRRLAHARLAQEVLAEIPSQLTSFMKARLIQPPPLFNGFY